MRLQGMEDWDQEQLEQAIRQKHASENNNKPTEIVCKHFLDAVERRLYGWCVRAPLHARAHAATHVKAEGHLLLP